MTRVGSPGGPSSARLNRLRARHVLYNSLSALTVQALAILVLSPRDYGVFSLYYLAYAMGNTLCYSVLSEAWSRAGREKGVLQDWPRYCTMLTAICCTTLIPIVIISQIGGTIWIALTLGGAVIFSTYRTGARFYAASTDHDSLVGPADLANSITLILSYFLLQIILPTLEAMSLAWFLSGLASAALSERPHYESGYRPLRWFKDHWTSIRILMADSILSDLGSIGVPFVLSPLLGIAGFGVYRSVSSAALPVRLVMNPLRPFINRSSVPELVTAQTFCMLVGGALVTGGAAFVTLYEVHMARWFSGGVIFELSTFALPVGLFVTFNSLEVFFYLVIRTHFRGQRLMLYRLLQLMGAIAYPLIGFYLRGLSGAIWGFTLNTIFICLVSVVLVMWQRRVEISNG